MRGLDTQLSNVHEKKKERKKMGGRKEGRTGGREGGRKERCPGWCGSVD